MSGNKVNSIIHPWAMANFSAYTYYQIYAGVDSTAVINGVSVFLAATTILDIMVRSISADTATVYVMGDNINVSYDAPIIY